ncbi:MAG: PaaI family thioesterase [Polyangiales bacterium]
MDERLQFANGLLGTLDMEVQSATSAEVVIEWLASAKHHQPMGIVHGGVYCSAIETACSIGATLSARERDPQMAAVGLENHTSFIRAVREGKLRAVARPITRGRRTQVWQAEIKDEQDRVVATGQVRLLCVPRDGQIG